VEFGGRVYCETVIEEVYWIIKFIEQRELVPNGGFWQLTLLTFFMPLFVQQQSVCLQMDPVSYPAMRTWGQILLDPQV